MARRSKSRKRSRRKAGKPPGGAWLLLALAALAVGALLWWTLGDQRVPKPPLDALRRPAAGRQAPEAPSRAPGSAPRPQPTPAPTGAPLPPGGEPEAGMPPVPQKPPAGGRAHAPGAAGPVGHLALVIDDLGRSLDDVTALDALGVPLSYSVLPYEVRTRQVVARLSREGREVLLHLPMQGIHGNDPGPGALTVAMSPQQLAEATRAALARVPVAMGSTTTWARGSPVTAMRWPR